MDLYDSKVLYDLWDLLNGDQEVDRGDQEGVLCDQVEGHGDQVVVHGDQVVVLDDLEVALCDQVVAPCDQAEVDHFCNLQEVPLEVWSHACLCEVEGHHAEELPVMVEGGLVGPVGNHKVVG